MRASPSGVLQGPPDTQLDPHEPMLKRPVTRRFLLFKGALLTAFGVLTARLWWMQIVQGRQFSDLAEKNRIALQTVPAPRGVVYDRNGIVLAGNKANWNVTIVPANLPEDETERAAIFSELDRRLSPPWVLFISEQRLPTSPEAAQDVFRRVAIALSKDPDEVATMITAAIAEDQLPIVSDEIPREDVPALQRMIAGLPGVVLFSQPEFLVWQSVIDPRMPLVVHRGVTRDQALSLESRSLLLPGVGIQADPGRAYPSSSITAHVVGYVGVVTKEQQEESISPETGQPVYEPNDILGQAGMELVLEPILRGRKGFHVVEVDINRRIVRELNKQDPTPGASAALTIDLGLQKEASDALNTQLARASVGKGVAVAIDPATGEVLALVSLPSYSNQSFADGISARDYAALQQDKNDPLFNRCVGGLYAPGDCYKPLVALAALKEQVIDASTTHVCKGSIHIPVEYNEITRQFFGCWQPAGHGPLAVVGGLAQACDVFAYNLIVPAEQDARGKNRRYYETEIGGAPIEFKGLGVERINAFVRTAGLGRKLGIELAGEQEGLLPDPEWKRQQKDRGGWTVADTIQNGIGQGNVQVTPLQMATAFGAIVNGGGVFQPRLLKSILREGNTVIEEQPPVEIGRLEINDEHLNLVRQGLREAVTGGLLAGRLNVPGVAVGGIASVVRREPNEAGQEPASEANRAHAWCAAFAPFDNPRIVVAVLMERAEDGVSYAAPVAERMLRAFFHNQQPA